MEEGVNGVVLVHEVFPDLDKQYILKILKSEKWNVESCINRILTIGSPSHPPSPPPLLPLDQTQIPTKTVETSESESEDPKDANTNSSSSTTSELALVSKGSSSSEAKTPTNQEIEQIVKGQVNTEAEDVKTEGVTGGGATGVSLQYLCLRAALSDWKEASKKMEMLQELNPTLADRVIDFMWKHGVFDNNQEETKAVQEMQNVFDDLLNLDDDIEGDSEDEGEGDEGDSSNSSDFEGNEIASLGFMDMQIAKTLQKLEEETKAKLRKMEEEDSAFAMELIKRENQEYEKDQRADENLAKELAANDEQAKKRTTAAATPTDDESFALSLIMNEREQLQEQDKRKKMEDEDRKLAESFNLKQSSGGNQRQTTLDADAKLARQLGQEEDLRVAKQLEEQQQRRKKARDQEENDKKSTELVAKLLAEQEEEKARRAAKWNKPKPYVISPAPVQNTWNPPQAIIAHGSLPKVDLTSEGGLGDGSDWKDSRFFGDTHTLENFLRQRSGTIIRVKNVVKKDLAQAFEMQWMSFLQSYGDKSIDAKPKLAFHGTRAEKIGSITDKGLLVPGTLGVTHATDSGWYGKGIYLSPNPDISMGYTQGGKMLVCAVLMGKIFKCPARCDGSPCKPGYDSHESPCGGEYVLFKAAQVLPCYVIEFSDSKNYIAPTNAYAYVPPVAKKITKKQKISFIKNMNKKSSKK